MTRVVVGTALRDRLGDDGARSLAEYVENAGEAWRLNVVNTCTERFDARLAGYATQSEIADGVARIAHQIADLRVEILRWSFGFWLGQTLVIVAIVAALRN